ncbi:MAG: shikimate kinase [Pirellulaceae bacterium]|nr:shikimate kinase [Pirellulaceae bacterium]
MNVVLVGYRGTGKSAVGRRLAGQLGLRVVSLDAELQHQAGKSIPEVVQEVGWPGFRDLEEQIVAKFAAEDGQVLDCGGGVIEREANFERLRAAGPVVWLKASTATIVSRIQGDTQRPSLTKSCSAARRCTAGSPTTKSTPTAARSKTSPARSSGWFRRHSIGKSERG